MRPQMPAQGEHRARRGTCTGTYISEPGQTTLAATRLDECYNLPPSNGTGLSCRRCLRVSRTPPAGRAQALARQDGGRVHTPPLQCSAAMPLYCTQWAGRDPTRRIALFTRDRSCLWQPIPQQPECYVSTPPNNSKTTHHSPRLASDLRVAQLEVSSRGEFRVNSPLQKH